MALLVEEDLVVDGAGTDAAEAELTVVAAGCDEVASGVEGDGADDIPTPPAVP